MTAPDAADRILPPIEVRNLEHAKQLIIYRNGDLHYPGRKFHWNKRQIRTFDAFLGALTDKVRLQNGAVRRVYTPVNGSRVTDFTNLEDGGIYVAAAQEPFRKLKYTDIEKTPRRRGPVDISELVKRNPRFEQISGKIRKTNTQGIRIMVWPNKETINSPKPVTLTPVFLDKWESCLFEIDRQLRDKCFGSIVRLYSRDGALVTDPSQLKQDQCYVACRKHDPFRHVPYKERAMKNFMTSPNIDRNKIILPPLNSSRGSTKTGKQFSPDQSHSSYPNSENSYNQRFKKGQSYRREPREEDEVFPRKPVTLKRDRKKVQEVDLDRDEGGVFRSKQKNRYTQGAREIRDTRDTRVDLPIDQVPAEEVKDEEVDSKPPPQNEDNVTRVPSEVELTKLPSDPDNEDAKDEEDERIRARESKPNSNNNHQAYAKTKSKVSGEDRRRPGDPRREQKRPERGDGRRRRQLPHNLANTHRDYDEPQSLNQYDDNYEQPDNHRRHSLARTDGGLNITPTPRKSPDEHQRYSPARSDGGRDMTPTPRKSPDEHQNSDRWAEPTTEERGKDDVTYGEREAAATKIQAHYKGYKQREKYHNARSDEPTGRRSAGSDHGEQPDDPGHGNVERAAATTIQAGFRGYQTRKALKNSR